MSWYGSGGKDWKMQIQLPCFGRTTKKFITSYHDNEVDAARAFDVQARKFGRPCNFSDSDGDSDGDSDSDSDGESDGDSDGGGSGSACGRCASRPERPQC